MSNSSPLIGKKPAEDHHNHNSRFWLIVIVVVMLVLAAIGIIIRMVSHARLDSRTEANAIPTVSVVKPEIGPGEDNLTLPGNLQAFVDAPLYARTDGYLKAWYFDIGAKVKKGQLIAVIETPELDQQLEQARAAVGTAKANYALAVVTNKRYQVLVRTAAVSKQEADQSASNEAAQKAQVDAALANVKHYEALQSFEKIYAPFDGVVTERNTDIGQLVSSGTGSGGGSGTNRELFRVAAIDKLRTFVDVPQNQSPYVVAGAKADIHLVERPTQSFEGTVARTSRSIDATSRTLLTEIDIDNRNGDLLPGAYVDVHLHIPSDNVSGAVRVPANTLVFRAHGMQVAVVGSDNKIHLRDASIGRDFGNTVELVSGVGKDDQVVLNPPDSLSDGQQVKVAEQPKEQTTAAQDGQSDKKKDDKSDSSSSSEDKNKSGKQPKDIPPTRGSTEPVSKASRAPDKKDQGDKQGGDSSDNKTTESGSSKQSGDVSGDKKADQSGGEPISGQTAPGTDGNGAK